MKGHKKEVLLTIVVILIGILGLLQLFHNEASTCVQGCTYTWCGCYWSGGNQEGLQGHCYSYNGYAECFQEPLCNNEMTCGAWCGQFGEGSCTGGIGRN